MAHPCATDPELWFGYPDDDGSDGAAKARAYERSATQARIQCLRRCPLLQQRRCAQHAVEHRVEYGVWAGIKLPGGQYRKREQLAAAHDVLRRIAGGEINSRQLPDNAALLARNEGLEVTPVPGVVVHLPIAQVGCRACRPGIKRPVVGATPSPTNSRTPNSTFSIAKKPWPDIGEPLLRVTTASPMSPPVKPRAWSMPSCQPPT